MVTWLCLHNPDAGGQSRHLFLRPAQHLYRPFLAKAASITQWGTSHYVQSGQGPAYPDALAALAEGLACSCVWSAAVP